jgi:transcriptional regulator with XRE-family HTH domain
MSPQEAFVTRLRRYRQKNRITLDEIAADTRVKRELLEALENNDLSQWPRGVYARAWIRTYAATVGLDPTETVDEFCRLFPQGDRRASATIRDMAAIVASPSDYRDEFDLPEDRRRATALELPSRPLWHAPMTQSARVLWARLATLASPHLRARRAPRPSS